MDSPQPSDNAMMKEIGRVGGGKAGVAVYKVDTSGTVYVEQGNSLKPANPAEVEKLIELGVLEPIL